MHEEQGARRPQGVPAAGQRGEGAAPAALALVPPFWALLPAWLLYLSRVLYLSWVLPPLPGLLSLLGSAHTAIFVLLLLPEVLLPFWLLLLLS